MNGNYGLVYPAERDYYDVNVTNSNFSKLADGIDSVKSGGLKREVVVASYDTVNPYKSVSDFVCTKNNASAVLSQAAEKCCEGGVIVLLDGTYILSSTVEFDKTVTIVGYGMNTRIVQSDVYSNYSLIKINGANSVVKDICIEDNVKSTRFVHLVAVSATSVSFCNCNFIINNQGTGNEASPIYTQAYRCRIMMLGCYIRKHSNNKYVINAGDTVLLGVVTGNYCECIDDDSELAISINVINNNSAGRVKYGAQNTEFYVKGVAYNG